MTWKKIGSVEDFPEKDAREITIGRVPVCVIKVDGEFYAIHDICPHKNLPLHRTGDELYVSDNVGATDGDTTWGRVDEEACTIACPWHDLEWDLQSGYNPLLDRSIPTFDIKTEGGNVYLET